MLLEKIEDKNGEIIVSAIKAQKIKGWYKLEQAYEDNQSIIGKLLQNVRVELLLNILILVHLCFVQDLR